MALHERAFEMKGTPWGAVLFESDTKHSEPDSREVVASAAEKLGIIQLVWLD
jgi:hypothetical protein